MHIALACIWWPLCLKQLWGQSVSFLWLIIRAHHLSASRSHCVSCTECPQPRPVVLIKETELSNLNLVCVAQRCQSWQIMNWGSPPTPFLKHWAETNKFILFRITGWILSAICEKRMLSSLIKSTELRQTLSRVVGVLLIWVGPENVLSVC